MRGVLVLAAAICLVVACGDQGAGPAGVSDDRSFLGVPIARDAVAPKVLGTTIGRLDEGDIGRLLKEGRLTAEEARLEGDVCPVLLDCWWTDEQEFREDPLWENYCAIGPALPRAGVLLFKVGDLAPGACPIVPAHLIVTMAFTMCREGKPDPRPLISEPISIDLGPAPPVKGIYFGAFILGALPGGGPIDAFFLIDWDGTGLLPIDDSCGLDLWERGDGRIFPPRILMIFGPEPPYPPGGFPPCRLDGEDGETRPWCVLVGP